jgi:hypothetical protein
MEGPLKRLFISSRSVNKHGCHRQFCYHTIMTMTAPVNRCHNVYKRSYKKRIYLIYEIVFEMSFKYYHAIEILQTVQYRKLKLLERKDNVTLKMYV